MASGTLSTPPAVVAPAIVTGDAFGETLLAAMRAGARPGAVSEIVERDDGFITAVDAARYFRSPDQWAEPIRWGVERAGGRVLDAGAGAGQHALAAERAGCQVTCLDVSAGALAVARQRGAGRVVLGSVAQADTLFSPQSFDTVFLFGQNLALLGSPAAAGPVLRALHTVTRPGAVIIGDSRDPSVDRDLHGDHYAFNESRGRWPGQLTLRVRRHQLATPWFDYLFCSPEQLAELARPHGWRLAEVRGQAGPYVAVLQRRREGR
jgi:SAM-dependent methyltransferase